MKNKKNIVIWAKNEYRSHRRRHVLPEEARQSCRRHVLLEEVRRIHLHEKIEICRNLKIFFFFVVYVPPK